MEQNLRLSKLVGGGYDGFWNFKGRYRVVKGGRASKKSRTAALWFVYNMMEFPAANLLVVRKTYNSLKNSCFSELKWAIDSLKAGRLWKVKTSPLEMNYLKGGNVYFRGLDDSIKLTSITADKGKLCWIWIEEAFEISSEEDFNTLDETVRGKVGRGLFKQATLTFNPWNENHWLKKRFFDARDDDIFTLTTDYTCNEWLDEADKALFERMKKTNPRRYRVAGLGEWGVLDGLVFEDWEERHFSIEEIKRKKGVLNPRSLKSAFGLDFGYTNDPTALCCMMVDAADKTIYVFDELYEFGCSNRDIYEKIRALGYGKERIYADSAEPKSIDELYSLGLSGIRKARKGKDSVNHGIQFIKGHKLVILPKCVNFLREISAYSWAENASGARTNTPSGGYDHLMDAMRYGLTEVCDGERWGF
ncbi:MAG: PBSX family phage terminase large subunit [Oscillospiraceae bacterium]|jgi:phage terminase large subunit|nr:PBSX family phage terminase large subunit [Oscillospiraceae bacterium]